MKLPWVIISRDEYEYLLRLKQGNIDVINTVSKLHDQYVLFRQHVAKHNPQLLQKRDAQGRFTKEKW